VVSAHTGFNVLYDPGMAAFLIGQPDPDSKPAPAGTDGAVTRPGPGMNQLAQSGIKPEPHLGHLQGTP
jgi:hypothetical protein